MRTIGFCTSKHRDRAGRQIPRPVNVEMLRGGAYGLRVSDFTLPRKASRE